MRKNKVHASEKDRYNELLLKRNRFGAITICRNPLNLVPKSIWGLNYILFGAELFGYFTCSPLRKVNDFFFFAKEMGLSKKEFKRYVEEGLLTGEDKLKGNAPATWYILIDLLPLVMKCDKVLLDRAGVQLISV
ncbi:MAG: hypothetical protein KAW52_02395, partial [candidate division Zixibacteria bacterium]|nr:hypothetical protein [candidate division Zixibacteria bacterium]